MVLPPDQCSRINQFESYEEKVAGIAVIFYGYDAGYVDALDDLGVRFQGGVRITLSDLSKMAIANCTGNPSMRIRDAVRKAYREMVLNKLEWHGRRDTRTRRTTR